MRDEKIRQGNQKPIRFTRQSRYKISISHRMYRSYSLEIWLAIKYRRREMEKQSAESTQS